ncbi:MAG TPA: hypothetical protein DCS67_07815 [Clostridiales bacterium UBA8960]|nr:hypothetical protein [Clostridiales bacterium UBA8960]
MNRFNPDASLANMWKAYNNMPTKTTVLDRIVEKEKSEQRAYINDAISQATSANYINSKKVSGEFFKRLDRAKAQQAQNTSQTINEIRRFVGKGMKIDAYV